MADVRSMCMRRSNHADSDCEQVSSILQERAVDILRSDVFICGANHGPSDLAFEKSLLPLLSVRCYIGGIGELSNVNPLLSTFST
jgi:hypothetical protein